MINVTQQCESLNTGAPNVVGAVAGTAVDLLPDRRTGEPGANRLRYCYRSIQNVGTTNIYVAQGVDASANPAVNRFHYILAPLAWFNVYTLERISAVCPDAALVVATMEIDRPY